MGSDGDYILRRWRFFGAAVGGGGGVWRAQGARRGEWGNGKARSKETAGYTGKTCKTP